MIRIQLDKERTFQLDLAAMVQFEEITGKSLLKVEKVGDMSMKEFQAFIWVGLIADDPTLTMEQVGHMVDFSNLTKVSEAIAASVGGVKAETPL